MPVHWVREGAHDGNFTVESDRAKVSKVMQKAFESKLASLRGREDRTHLFRYLVAGQNRLLRLPSPALTPESFPARFGFESMEAAISTKTGMVATACAVLAEDVEMLRWLAAAGAELNPQLPGIMEAGLTRGWTPLHLAASHCNPSLVQELLHLKANPNSCNRGGMPALGFCRSVEAVDLMLASRAGVNFSQQPGGLTPLALSSLFCPPPCVLQRLLQAGADSNNRGCGIGLASLSSLALAANVNPHLAEHVALLVAAQADVNLPSEAQGVVWVYELVCRLKSYMGLSTCLMEKFAAGGGSTALQVAALLGREQLVCLLLQAAADPTLLNKQGHTASQLARRSSLIQFLKTRQVNMVLMGHLAPAGQSAKLLGTCRT